MLQNFFFFLWGKLRRKEESIMDIINEVNDCNYLSFRYIFEYKCFHLMCFTLAASEASLCCSSNNIICGMKCQFSPLEDAMTPEHVTWQHCSGQVVDICTSIYESCGVNILQPWWVSSSSQETVKFNTNSSMWFKLSAFKLFLSWCVFSISRVKRHGISN